MPRTRASSAEFYLQRRLHSVRGWLQPGAARLVIEAAKMQTHLGITGNVAEIGVHEGKFFILLCLLRSRDEKAVAIDVFEQQELNRDRSGRGNKERLMRNLHRHVSAGEPPILISSDSRTVASDRIVELAGGTFRIFSVDGGHEAETVSHDLEVAAGTLCDGGVIVLDDYFNEGWPGVADGTNRFFRTAGAAHLAPFAIAQNKTLITSRGYAEMYRQALTHELKDRSRIRESTLFGHPVSYFNFGLNRAELLVTRFPGLVRVLRRFRDSM